MKRAIIFDMDGVIVQSEQLWNDMEPGYLRKVLAPSIATQIIGKTRGLSEGQIYMRAKELGHAGTKEDFFHGYDVLAEDIYRIGAITPGIDDLIGLLAATPNVHVGLVSASPKSWIQVVLERLRHGTKFSFVESVNDHPELKPKPAPDGYIAAMNALGTTTRDTLIIEDSQTGINAAIASGAHVCGFALFKESDIPHGADIYAHTIEDVQRISLGFATTGHIQ